MPDQDRDSALGAEATTPDLKAMTAALNRIDEYAALGRTPIAHLPLVTDRLAQYRLRDTPFQRGRIASHLILDTIRAQVPSDRESAGRDAVEWTILYLRVHNGKALEEISSTLSMPLRSVARYYARAKGLLLDRLLDLANAPDRSGIYCPRCGTFLLAGAATPGAETECPGCNVGIRSEINADGALHVHAHPLPGATGPESIPLRSQM